MYLHVWIIKTSHQTLTRKASKAAYSSCARLSTSLFQLLSVVRMSLTTYDIEDDGAIISQSSVIFLHRLASPSGIQASPMHQVVKDSQHLFTTWCMGEEGVISQLRRPNILPHLGTKGGPPALTSVPKIKLKPRARPSLAPLARTSAVETSTPSCMTMAPPESREMKSASWDGASKAAACNKDATLCHGVAQN